ncbi:MAG: hypothetical protein LWX56_11185 [Ignavibacteria bacterium]|nr:hypothetical protein [Ignavibacteria bacterium]
MHCFGTRYGACSPVRRYSEPGRWMSLDPLAKKYPGWSPYAYCKNNPIIFIDPNGKELKVFGDKQKAFNRISNLAGEANKAYLSFNKETGTVSISNGFLVAGLHWCKI